MGKDRSMNEETKEVMEALGVDAGGAGDQQGATPDYKALYEEVKRELASAKVDQGRVRKLDAELKSAQAKVAELEKSAAIENLPENVKEALPPESLESSLMLAKSVFDRGISERDQRLSEIEKSVAEERQRRTAMLSGEFVSKINASFPGFTKGLKEGGAFKSAWDAYQTHNGASIREAFATLNYDTLAYHIKRFYETSEVDPSGGRDTNAAPDPRRMGGGTSAGTQFGTRKTYTPDQWEREYDDLQDQYDRGVIGPKDYESRRKILTDAYKEGRVKAAHAD